MAYDWEVEGGSGLAYAEVEILAKISGENVDDHHHILEGNVAEIRTSSVGDNVAALVGDMKQMNCRSC